MTHDTPGETDDERRWCANCALAVEPAPSESGSECPACGQKFS